MCCNNVGLFVDGAAPLALFGHRAGCGRGGDRGVPVLGGDQGEIFFPRPPRSSPASRTFPDPPAAEHRVERATLRAPCGRRLGGTEGTAAPLPGPGPLPTSLPGRERRVKVLEVPRQERREVLEPPQEA